MSTIYPWSEIVVDGIHCTAIRRTFVAYFFPQGWDHIQLGVSISPSIPNIEIHVPFGFFRIGFEKYYEGLTIAPGYKDKSIGWTGRKYPVADDV